MVGARSQIGNRHVHKIQKDGMIDLIKSIAAAVNQGHGQKPFYVLDLGALDRAMDKWELCLSQVKPFYAVKCNSDPTFLAALAMLSANFDCASQGEMESVLCLGIHPDRIIYANPCKAAAHIEYAAAVGVNLATFDSMMELEKMKKWHPKCNLLLRIKAPNDSHGSLRPLGKKFGALPEEVEPLLQYAVVTGLRVVGVSFHVGSIAQDPIIYHHAIAAARAVFDMAAKLRMPAMHVLNIGGGFRAGTQLFEHISNTINSAIRDYFPKDIPIVIAEPGRYFAETAFTLAAHVIGIRARGEKREYWINDGIYGSFRPTLYNSSFVTIKPAFCTSVDEPSMIWPSVIYGPSCDSLDEVTATEIKLPELQLHDLLVFTNMGAYSRCAGTKFNGFDTISVPTYIAYTY